MLKKYDKLLLSINSNYVNIRYNLYAFGCRKLSVLVLNVLLTRCHKFTFRQTFDGFKCIEKLNSVTKLCSNRLSKNIFSIASFQIRFYILIFDLTVNFCELYVYFVNTASRKVCISRNLFIFLHFALIIVLLILGLPRTVL